MKRILFLLIPATFVNGVFLPALVAAQTKKPSSEQPIATAFRIEDPGPNYSMKVDKLYITVGGRERKIADIAVDAWIINGGKELVYSAPDGVGGYEDEGESLRLYDVKTDKTRKILSEYYMVDKVTEVRLSTDAAALLVEMSDGGLGASYFAVVDPKRGEVLFRKWAKLTKIKGDHITLGFYDDWVAINEEGRSVKPFKTETHDLKKVIKKKVIYNKPDPN